ESHRRDLIDAVAGGRLDLLVNNASLLGPSPQPNLADYDLDMLGRVYDVNVFAPLRLLQLALPLLRASAGHIVNITSDAAVEGYEGWGGYGSSKAAFEQWSRVLAAEEPAVRVWWVDPGDMNTRMHQEAFPGEDISDRQPPEAVVPALLELIDRDTQNGLEVHFSTSLPAGLHLIELREPRGAASVPHDGGTAGDRLLLPEGAEVELLTRWSGGDRLWVANVEVEHLSAYLQAHGHPI